jgi:hypothetical protein
MYTPFSVQRIELLFFCNYSATPPAGCLPAGWQAGRAGKTQGTKEIIILNNLGALVAKHLNCYK